MLNGLYATSQAHDVRIVGLRFSAELDREDWMFVVFNMFELRWKRVKHSLPRKGPVGY